MCDCEPPTGYSETVRTARKEHRCCECERTISRGERYQYASGVWDHRGSSFKTCLRCVAVRERIGAVRREHGDCGPCFRDLVYDLLEGEHRLFEDAEPEIAGHVLGLVMRSWFAADDRYQERLRELRLQRAA